MITPKRSLNDQELNQVSGGGDSNASMYQMAQSGLQTKNGTRNVNREQQRGRIHRPLRCSGVLQYMLYLINYFNNTSNITSIQLQYKLQYHFNIFRFITGTAYSAYFAI